MSELARLSQILHSGESKERVFAMFEITAYADESFDDVRTEVFVFAGYIAGLETWKAFEAKWQGALDDFRLEEFKASDCEGGKGQFKGWTEKRLRKCKERFVTTIRDARLDGGAAVIDLKAWKPYQPEITQLRTIQKPKGGVIKFGHPYYLGFQFLTEILAGVVNALPSGERAVFVYDINAEHKGKALELFEHMKRDTTNSYHARMEGAYFTDSRDRPGLQAADLLAFEVRRHFEGVLYGRTGEAQRWQWAALTEGQNVSVNIQHMNDESMAKFMPFIREQWGDAV